MLLLLVVTYVIEVASPTDAWTRVVTVSLQGLTLVVAMAASRVRRSTIRLTGAVVTLCTLAAIVIAPNEDGGAVRGSFYLVSLVLVLVAPVVIVRGVAARPVIDVRTVLGALCVYVLAGMTFAFGYGAIGAFGAHPFFAQQAHATISDYLYFSFVTLTTVGYGDLTAAGGFGRAAAVLEALLGQIYLVTVVALLVGAMSRRRRNPPGAMDDERAGHDGGQVT
ncbi:MAG TPA: potassium channel family protein [Acidimicrobiia bacterium]|nr:potassium channel family protein [Acidimicrobiia bacterium]